MTTLVLYLLQVAHSRTHGHGGREQAGRVAFVVQVINELSVFGFLCNQVTINNQVQKFICLSSNSLLCHPEPPSFIRTRLGVAL